MNAWHGSRVITWRAGFRDSTSLEHAIEFVADDQTRIADWLALLTPGRAFVSRGEIVTRSVMRGAIVVGEVVVLRVIEIEFPDRTARRNEPSPLEALKA